MKLLRLLLPILLSALGASTSFAQTNWNWANPRPEGNDLFGVTIKSASLVIAVGAKGTVARRVNGSWQTPLFLTSQTLRCVSHWASVVWAVGDSGTIFKSTDDGATWASQTSGHPTINLQAVLALSATHVVVCGDSCYVLESTNGGSSWSHISELHGRDSFDRPRQHCCWRFAMVCWCEFGTPAGIDEQPCGRGERWLQRNK